MSEPPRSADSSPDPGGTDPSGSPTRHPDFPFNLTDEQVTILLEHKDFDAFLKEKGMSMADFMTYLRSGREKLREKEGREKTPEDEEKRKILDAMLHKIRAHADAAKNDAVYAQKLLDDAEVAFREGILLPPDRVLELVRPRDRGGYTLPTVISSGANRIFVSTTHSLRGLRAPGGYYDAFEASIQQLAREFVFVKKEPADDESAAPPAAPAPAPSSSKTGEGTSKTGEGTTKKTPPGGTGADSPDLSSPPPLPRREDSKLHMSESSIIICQFTTHILFQCCRGTPSSMPTTPRGRRTMTKPTGRWLRPTRSTARPSPPSVPVAMNVVPRPNMHTSNA